MTEQEELEYLRLKKKKALAQQGTKEKPASTESAPSTSVGASASDIVRGAGGAVGAVLDLPYNAINLAKMGFGTAATAAGRPDLAPEITPPPFGPMIQEGLTKAGLPENAPTDISGRLLQRANQGAGGVLVGAGMSRAAIPNASPSLVREGIGLGGQSVGGEIATSLFPGSPTADIIGSVAGGSLGVSGLPSGASQTTALGRQANLDTLRRTGIQKPTAGQVTQAPVYQWTEAALSKTPAGGYVMYKTAKDIQESMGKTVKSKASSISSATSQEQAGRAIKRGTEQFVNEFKGGWDVLDNKVAQFFSSTDGVPVTNTLLKLDEMIAQGQGADASLAALDGSRRATLIALRDAIAQDAQAGAMPYGGFRLLRSETGRKSASTSLLSEVPTSTYKAIYGAMSEDLKLAASMKDEAARLSGQPTGAVKALNDQNKYWSAGRRRIDDVLDPLLKNKPEDIYRSAVSGSDKGATTLWALRRSLPDKDWQDFAAVFIERMGRSKAGQQDAAGEQWSAQRFLTDYNSLSPNARKALFSSPVTPGLEADINAIAKASDLVTRSGKQYANPSGTAQASVSLLTLGGTAMALSQGLLRELTAIGTFVGGSYGGAKLMTNPAFVKWLAESPSVKPARLGAYAGRLSNIAEQSNDPEERNAILDYQAALWRKAMEIPRRPVNTKAVPRTLPYQETTGGGFVRG